MRQPGTELQARADALVKFFFDKGPSSYLALCTQDGSHCDGHHSPGLVAMNAVAALPHAILGQGLGVEALLLYHSNPCFSVPSPERFERALARIPFVVSFTPMPDDTSRFADLILPDHTYLERLQDAPTYPFQGWPMAQLRVPAVKPLYDTKSEEGPIIDAEVVDDNKK